MQVINYGNVFINKKSENDLYDYIRNDIRALDEFCQKMEEESVVEHTDDIYDYIRIKPDHIQEILDECDENEGMYDTGDLLVEELSELIQAIIKTKRVYSIADSLAVRDNLIEEIAHVLISLKAFVSDYAIRPENVQDKIVAKNPKFYLKGEEK